MELTETDNKAIKTAIAQLRGWEKQWCVGNVEPYLCYGVLVVIVTHWVNPAVEVLLVKAPVLGQVIHGEVEKLRSAAKAIADLAEHDPAEARIKLITELCLLSTPLIQRLERLVKGCPTQAPTLSAPAKKAYQSYERAEKVLAETLGRPPRDQEAYKWLKEHDSEDYELPAFATWQRYVRLGRNYYHKRKHEPRAGRPSDLPKASQIDSLGEISNQFSQEPD